MTASTILIGTIAAVALAVALYILCAWALARLWCNPQRQPDSKTPADYSLPFEVIQFSSQGVRLSGWFIPAAATTARQPVLILAHGWSRSAAEMLLIGRPLHEANFALLLYDARGHGQSDGDGPITILKCAQDILAAVDYLETRPDVDMTRVGVLGRSMGGSAAILAASMEPRLRTIVSCSAFADPKELTRGFLRMMHVPVKLFERPVFWFIERWLGTSMDHVAPWNRIADIAAPILLIHGEADRFIQASNLETIYAHAPQAYTERLLIPKRGHSDLMRDSKASHAMVAFLIKNLAPAGQVTFCETATRARRELVQVKA